jgi:hypothetical protein
MGERTTPRIFICYSREDEPWKDQLERHLYALTRQTKLEIWSDRQIEGGQEWRRRIKEAIDRAHLAVLLVSTDFLNSSFIWDEELPRLLTRRKEGLVVLPLIVDACNWEEVAEISRLQVRPTSGRPLASLRKPDREKALAKFAAEILDLLPRITGSNAATAAFIANYRKRLSNAFSSWKLSTLLASRAGIPRAARLDDMYLPLRLAATYDINKLDLGGPVGPEELLARKRSLVVRGPAGAGKTTWLHWTFRRLLDHEEALPLMLVLRDVALHWQTPEGRGASRSIDSFLSSWVAEHTGTGCEESLLSLRQCLSAEEGPRPILLVDGWDEIGDLGEELRRKLLGFSSVYPRLLLVVTSRPYGEARPSENDSFEELDIQPLSDLEIHEFSRRFFFRGDQDAAVAAEEHQQFLSELNRSREAKALARTPLLLTMMMLVGRSRQSLPKKRHLLYEYCVEHLLIELPDRKQKKGARLSVDHWRPEEGEDRIRAAAALAAGIQERRGHQPSARIGSWNDLADLLPGKWSKANKTRFLAWLSGPAWLLTGHADGTLAFTHLSFQDYLASWHLNATHKDPQECVEAFRQRLRIPLWWETLRLWAALIEQDAERLDTILEAALTDGSNSGDALCFAGTLLADGLGSDARFDAWIKAFSSALASHWLNESDLCARAWAVNQQKDRGTRLGDMLSRQARSASWPGWVRIQSVSRQALDRQPELPQGIASRALLGHSDLDDLEIAAGRVLCGGPAIWPVDPLEIGLLQLWPSSRRSAALRLQLAAACGSSLKHLVALATTILQQINRSRDAEEQACRWARGWARDWNREWVQEWARHLVQFHDLEQASDPQWVHDWFHYWACGWARRWDPDEAREWAREWARYWGRYWDSKWALDRARHWSHEWAGFWARESGMELQPWLEQFAFHDLASAGRNLGRVIITHAHLPDGEPTASLLAFACRISLAGHPATPAEQQQISTLAGGLDPLWPALARHLTRCSSQTDRELLVDLARNPEKREPPLSWGLRYIVRGDILLEDGRTVTLDQLTDEAALPRRPFLDEMLPEPEVHGDSESIGRR